MEKTDLSRGINTLLTQYKYPVLILLLGLVLMLLPRTTETQVEEIPAETVGYADLGEQLEAILRQIEGAGEVRVLLTEQLGRETVYQTDTRSDSGESGSSLSADTVLVEDESRTETGLVRQTLEPVYRGAVILCQGADSPGVKLAIVEAVRCATGLRTDQISVLKMK